MKYAYPAIFTPAAEGGYDVKVPDLPGCRTCGDDLADAIFMAEDAISMWLWTAENKNEVIPAATVLQSVEAPRFINYVYADTDAYRKKNDARAVKKTLSIPSWLNTMAEEAGVNFSQILQEALKARLGVQ
ncbi:type II toxin-antitoxin system HicB family antitoxin [uncultured Oscillibacter sp.]|uniref:type II toxin-antitoxin system HicB family antitoxin n=1 Tax=uncultured Oscillibacter sp. TaxID=876091 RepID=UPI0025DD9595|nr:type II toxin-antitoxin system HicB family antitoxin [uncultured Oscillibacter sp.]